MYKGTTMNTFKGLLLTTIMPLVVVSNSAITHSDVHGAMGSEKAVA